MRLRIQDIGETTKELVYEEGTQSLNSLVMRGVDQEFQFDLPARVNLSYYRAGLEVFLDGRVKSVVSGECARCLEWFTFTVDAPLSFVLVPRGGRAEEKAYEESDLDYYDGHEVHVSPLVHERILLSLPTRPLCRDGCLGLCPVCGINRNETSCNCEKEQGDPRLAILRTLKVR